MRDGEKEGKNEKVVKKMKNEKVAKGRIIGLAGPCFIVSGRQRLDLDRFRANS